MEVIVSGVVQEVKVNEKSLEITVSGKNGRFFRVRGKALGKMTERFAQVEEGLPYLFFGGLITRKDKEGRESFELGFTRAVPLAHAVSQNEYGSYLDGATNQVTLYGRLGADAEVKYVPISTDEGEDVVSVALMRVAVKSGERTVWVNVKAWSLDETLLDALVKGAPVYVDGEYRLESWEKDGEKKYRPAIIAKKVYAGVKVDKPEGEPEPVKGKSAKPAPKGKGAGKASAKPAPKGRARDDDLPF